MALIKVVLPAPLGPTTQTNSFVLHIDGHVPQGRRRAVIDKNVLNFKHGAFPR